MLIKNLVDDFVVVNLGSGGDRDYVLPPEWLRAITLVEIDAAAASRIEGVYHRHIRVNQVVAGSAVEREFIKRRFTDCSSLLQPRADLITLYGLESFFEEVGRERVQCTTLPALLEALDLSAVDFLKTDLEGEDFAVLQSAQTMLNDTLAVQSELRFEPFYHGEPMVTEVIDYLRSHDFELIGLRPEYWKPRTETSSAADDGKIAWADCLFLKRWESVSERGPLAVVKQILILCLVGRLGYAGYLLERAGAMIPADWRSELQPLLQPATPSWSQRARSILKRQLARLLRHARGKGAFPLRHLARW